MRDTPMQKMTYLIEEIDDAVYNDRGYSFISGLLDELKEDIAQNFAPGIVIPENKEITYQHDHNEFNSNPVVASWMDSNGIIHREYLKEGSAPYGSPWSHAPWTTPHTEDEEDDSE